MHSNSNFAGTCADGLEIFAVTRCILNSDIYLQTWWWVLTFFLARFLRPASSLSVVQSHVVHGGSRLSCFWPILVFRTMLFLTLHRWAKNGLKPLIPWLQSIDQLKCLEMVLSRWPTEKSHIRTTKTPLISDIVDLYVFWDTFLQWNLKISDCIYHYHLLQ